MQLTSEARRSAHRKPWTGILPLLLASLLLPAGAATQPTDYIVGANDVLSITVFDQPQLTGKYVVQTDGTFTFPLLGPVRGGGQTVQAIQDNVRDRLSQRYLKNPQVIVAVEQYRSQQIYVIGEVRQPATLQFMGAMTLIEALARAGSTTERAGMEAIVVRQAPGATPPDLAAIQKGRPASGADVIRVDLEGLQSGVLSQNIALRGGDTIFVPRAPSAFVSGQVRTAGEYVIRTGMTVRQVIALAGGVTDRGSTRRIQIIRQVGGKEVTVGATLQDIVQPGDTVVVRERLF